MPPEGWITCTVGDLLEATFAGEWGADPRGTHNALVLRATNMVGRGLIYETAARRSVPEPVLATKELRDGDLILEGSGGSTDQPVGRIARFAADAAPAGRYVCSNFFRVLRVNDARVLPAYAEALLQQLWEGPPIRPLQRQTTGIINLDFQRYLKVSVEIPESIDEQHAIVGVLRHHRAVLEGVRREAVRRQQLFRGLRQALLNPQPDWSRSRLGEVADVVGGGTPPVGVPAFWGGPLRWITPSDVTASDGLFQTDGSRSLTQAGVAASGARILPAGSVVVTSRATIGEARLNTKPMATNQGFQSLAPRSSVSAEYLLFWVQENRADWERQASGSTFLEIPRARVERLPISFPGKDDQAEITRALLLADAAYRKTEREADRLEGLGVSVRDDLLTGRVRV